MRPSSPDLDLAIVDALAGAALDPALWREALARLARRVGCDGAGILTQDTALRTGFPVAGVGVELSYTQQYFRHYASINPVLHSDCGVVPPLGRPLTTSALMSRHAFAMTEFYNGWLRPQRFSDAIGVVVQRQGAQFTWLAAMRPHGAGEPDRDELDALARLAPHVTRALRVAQRLGVLARQQQALQGALDRVTHAMMLVDRRGRLIFANAAAEALFEPGQALMVVHGRVAACDGSADAALQAALARSMPGAHGGHRVVVDVAVPREGRRPLILSVVSTGCGVAGQLACDPLAAAVIIVTDPDVRPWTQLDGFVRAYGLTPAEARVLDAILDGDGLDRIAGRLAIGRATVKTHVNRILAKTGTTRQNELIRLVAGSLPPLRV